jgi:hypothetical protein
MGWVKWDKKEKQKAAGLLMSRPFFSKKSFGHQSVRNRFANIFDVKMLFSRKSSRHQKCLKLLCEHFWCRDAFSPKIVWTSKVSEISFRTFLMSRRFFSKNGLDIESVPCWTSLTGLGNESRGVSTCVSTIGTQFLFCPYLFHTKTNCNHYYVLRIFRPILLYTNWNTNKNAYFDL